MTDWVPESREIPDELTDEFEHETYPPAPVKFNTIADQLAAADPDTLRALANWGTGEANWSHTELGNE